jgi:hypothetical protein
MKIINLLAIIIVNLFLSDSFVSAETCTKDQAFDRMMAVGRAADKMLKDAGPDHDARRKQAELNKEVAAVGAILGEGKYDQACKIYSDIAAKWGINIKEASSGMLTMKELKKDGGKSRGGKCSLADASIKMNTLLQKLESMKAEGQQVDAISKAYYDMIGEKGDLMSTNPSAFCDEIDGFKKLYSLE